MSPGKGLWEMQFMMGWEGTREERLLEEIKGTPAGGCDKGLFKGFFTSFESAGSRGSWA